MASLHEACGIVGLSAPKPVAMELFYSLRVLQHRGQESAGIAVFDGKKIKCIKGMGLAHEVFNHETLEKLSFSPGIGHVRYSTAGGSVIENAQPMVVTTRYGDIALAHNGEIVNANILRAELQDKGWAFITTTDSEIIIRLLANELADTGNVVRALKNTMRLLVGSYSFVVIVKNRIYAVRDPHAIKPLSIGKRGEKVAVASESVVFDMLELDFVRDVEPGEIVEITNGEFRSIRTPAPPNHAHCMFEWVYFARPDSYLDGKLVHDVRLDIGRLLAKEHPVQADIVIPVPDSGRTHALGYAQESSIPYGEGLMKNRYIERTFIMPEQRDRELNVMLKINPLRSVIAGRRVVLVDDSIVRGTTTRKLIQILRNAGAKEVHLRVGCPPIRAPCYLGIDMKTRDQLIAVNRSSDEICALLGADSVGYISISGLVNAIGHSEKNLCLGCLTGEYPVPVPGERLKGQKTIEYF